MSLTQWMQTLSKQNIYTHTLYSKSTVEVIYILLHSFFSILTGIFSYNPFYLFTYIYNSNLFLFSLFFFKWSIELEILLKGFSNKHISKLYKFSTKCKTVMGESAWVLPANHSTTLLYCCKDYLDMVPHNKPCKHTSISFTWHHNNIIPTWQYNVSCLEC